MNLDIGRAITVIEGDKVTEGVIQRLFPSSDTAVCIRLSTGGLKTIKASEITENSDGTLQAVLEVVVVQQTKKKGLFGFFKK